MKNRIKNWLLKDLLCATITEDVFKIDKLGGIWIGNEKITEAELKNIKEEVKLLAMTRIWRVINETIKEQANRKIFLDSTNIDDIYAGKMMLYNLDLINKIINKINATN